MTHQMRRAAADEAQIGIGFNRGTNMHPIQLLEEATVDSLKNVGEASTSWIVAALLGSVLIGLWLDKEFLGGKFKFEIF